MQKLNKFTAGLLCCENGLQAGDEFYDPFSTCGVHTWKLINPLAYYQHQEMIALTLHDKSMTRISFSDMTH